ncbi:MAG: antibiotic biosynthesis monooxygenase family protein [Sphingorhabdus sp.]
MPQDPMVVDRTANENDAARAIEGVVMLVNLFTPKDGMEQAFIDAQTGEYVRLKGKVEGWIGNRLGRAVDGSGQLVNVAMFDSMANYNAWRESPLFAEHLDIIRPFVEKSAPGMYELLYSAGDM